MMNVSKKNGFTIAELLIALAILGIVAVMVLPSVFKNDSEHEFKAGTKKAYTILSQLTESIASQNGGTWPLDSSSDYSTDLYNNYLTPNLAVVQNCGTSVTANGDMTGGCWYNQTSITSLKLLNGTTSSNINPNGGLVLKDGMLFSVARINDGIANISSANTACTNTSGSITGICSGFLVDTNGNKSPNTVGKDIQVFYVLKNGALKAFGNADDGHDTTCNSSSTGIGCATNYLTQ